jgi:hypothetical protein
MFTLGEIANIKEVIEKPIKDRKAYNQKINDVFQSLILKVQRAQRMKGKPYIYREELEPHLTAEEIEFIGPYWKSKRTSDGGRVQYTKSYSLQKILLRKFSEANPDWKKEKIGEVAPVKYLQFG